MAKRKLRQRTRLSRRLIRRSNLKANRISRKLLKRYKIIKRQSWILGKRQTNKFKRSKQSSI